MTTRHFGTCFVAGSGTALIEALIRTADEAHVRERWPAQSPVTPSEDLAEHLSAEMLYRESDSRNGLDAHTPIDLGCGGYYEWYAVTPDGVRCLQPRLDLHVHVDQDGLTFTRIHFAEQHERVGASQPDVPSQRYYLMVMNLGLEPLRLSWSAACAAGYPIRPEACWLTWLESAFHAYDDAPGDRGRHKDGPLDADLLQHLFSQPLTLHRIRLLLYLDGEDGCIADRLVRPRTEAALATLRAEDGRLILELSATVATKIAKRAWRD